ncbi:MAG: peptide ABC transporter substrate-binding protein [Dehalococcoidia bacterium]
MSESDRPMHWRRRGAFAVLLVLGVVTLATLWLRTGQDSIVSATTYREAVVGQPARINPLAAPSNQAEADLTRLIFSGLMRLRADGTPEPELAERWEVTPDALTYTFHLRPDATWHDGAGFTAADVAFTIARIQAEGFTGPEALRAEWIDAQVFVADAQTLLVRLPEPSADFLTRATLGILPAHLAGEMETGSGFTIAPFDRAPVGTGPYRLSELRDDRAVLRHNTSYVLGAPPIRELELHFASSEAERLDWLQDGTVDAALLDESVTPDLLAQLTTAGGEEATRAATPFTAGTLTVLYFNNLRSPLNEPATRQAIAASLDASAAIASAGVVEVPATSVFLPGSWAAPLPPEAPTDSPDTDLLWTVAGWSQNASGRLVRDGEPLVLELVTNGEMNRVAIAESLISQLDAAGVTVELVTAPAQRVIGDYLRPSRFDLALFGWQLGNDPDPYGGWHTSQLGAGNVAVYSDPESDALLEVARTTLDVGERRELYTLFATRFAEQAPSVVISHPIHNYVHPAELQGIDPQRLLIRPEHRFADIHLWRLGP